MKFFSRRLKLALVVMPFSAVLSLPAAVNPAPAAASPSASAPAPAPEPAAEPVVAPVIAAAFARAGGGVNGSSPLANILTIPATTPGGRPTRQLGSTAFTWEKLVFTPSNVGSRTNISNLPTSTIDMFECHIGTLNPGQTSHPPHRHGNEEFIILKEGTLEADLGGVTPEVARTEHVGAGSVFFFASNQYHNVENRGDKTATYLVFNIHTAATPRTPPDGTPSDPVPAGKLSSVIFDWEKSVAKPTKTGSRRDIFNGATTTAINFECAVITLNAGQAEDTPTKRPDDELLAVKEGLLDVTINGKTERGTPGTIFYIASNDEHTIRNATDKPVSYHTFIITTERTPKAAAPAKVAVQ